MVMKLNMLSIWFGVNMFGNVQRFQCLENESDMAGYIFVKWLNIQKRNVGVCDDVFVCVVNCMDMCVSTAKVCSTAQLVPMGSHGFHIPQCHLDHNCSISPP